MSPSTATTPTSARATNWTNPSPGRISRGETNHSSDHVYSARAGATSITAPADQFYGDRTGGVQDACGNQWWIATHNEDVSAEELARRAEAAQR